jgi:glycosyltransferase involved in cell wall biosynthesis
MEITPTKGILVIFHTGSNIGYAIAPLERAFHAMAVELTGSPLCVHFAYKHMERGPTPGLPADLRYATGDLCDYIRSNGIDTIFGFDQAPSDPRYRAWRGAGVKWFVSYWGAAMSSEHGWLKRSVKRLGVILDRSGPDRYIFESHGMARLATHGRGIPPSRVSVVHLGVDTERYRPDPADSGYVYAQFDIPRDRRVFFYSGHFEPRKGVAVIMEAANRMIRDDWHILLCGNKGEESAPYASMLTGDARGHVTFAGYREDIPRLHRGCYAAIIASSGWDSLTMSSLEMQASGLPLLCSDLIGLRESIEDGKTGFLFRSGDGSALSGAMTRLLASPDLRDRLGGQARSRIARGFSLESQRAGLLGVMRAARSPSL